MAQDPYKYFRIEARELGEQLGHHALDLEKSDRPAEVVARLLRVAHTLKGAARVVKQTEIADCAHRVEDVLDAHRAGAVRVPRADVDAILSLVDRIASLTAALTPPEKTSTAPALQQARPDPRHREQADVAEMDALLEGLSEIHSQLGAARQSVQPLERMRHVANLILQQLSSPRRQTNAGMTLAMIAPMAEELRQLSGLTESKLTGGIDQLDREIRQARDVAERLRLRPVGTVFDSLERTARDAAQVLGKRVAFEAAGGELRLDARVLGVLQGALVQMVRNAVAHGIEKEDERVAAGKPPEGRISVEVQRRGKQAVFVCGDDGRGIDLEAIRRTLQRQGMPEAEARKLEQQHLLDRLFQGGISTSGTITEVSGRGIGLDVVRETAERLGGRVRVETEPGRRFAIEFIVPISLSSLDALVVEAGGVRAALPLDRIKCAVRTGPENISRTPTGKNLLYGNTAIPFGDLAEFIAARRPEQSGGKGSAIVMEMDGAATAVGIDRLLGVENIVVRTLPSLAPAETFVAGASLDAKGNPQIVLDLQALAARVSRAKPDSLADTVTRLPILVIDDSATTRMLEQSILEAAGYDTDVATSAEEALEKVRTRQYGLFLVDVEMPGMDGFTFVERTRADPDLRKVPAILVTSRNAPEDRQRGERAGAYGYIVKSEFDQNDLLSRIRKVVG